MASARVTALLNLRTSYALVEIELHSVTLLGRDLATNSSFRACARFEWFHVDLNSGELLRSGIRVPIQGQPLQVLRLLLEAEGKVVTRDHLRSALWPEDTFVDFEHGVNTAVKKLRQALEDSAENPRFIETLPKVGYRFIRPVEWEAEARTTSPLTLVVPIAPPEKLPARHALPRNRTRKLILALSLGVVASLAVVGFLITGNRRLSHTP